MSRRRVILVAGLLVGGTAAAIVARSALLDTTAAPAMTQAAEAWLASLAPEQVAKARREFADPRRRDWHFIPKFERKGLVCREMTPAQEALAFDLLRAAVSQAGYDKARGIMELDEILRIQEAEKARNVRDPKRYFFTIFGTPAATGSWGLSFEGHHLSLNFTVRDGRLVDSTPQMFGTNPAIVKTALPGLPPAGHRILRDEETLAFDLVGSFSPEQRTRAVVAPEAPKDIRGAGEAALPDDPPAGIAWPDLTARQKELVRAIVDVYCDAMVPEVAEERIRLIESAASGWDAVHVAWAGATEPGIGHYYRIEGPTFSIEFCNVQPDAEGTIANHIHCAWRDRTGDFE